MDTVIQMANTNCRLNRDLHIPKLVSEIGILTLFNYGIQTYRSYTFHVQYADFQTQYFNFQIEYLEDIALQCDIVGEKKIFSVHMLKFIAFEGSDLNISNFLWDVKCPGQGFHFFSWNVHVHTWCFQFLCEVSCHPFNGNIVINSVEQYDLQFCSCYTNLYLEYQSHGPAL